MEGGLFKGLYLGETVKMINHDLLWQLGVEPGHYDGMGRYREPSWETLRRVMASLGIAADNPDELPSKVAELKDERKKRLVETFVVGWEGKGSGIQVHPGPGLTGLPVDLAAVNEQGEEFWFRQDLSTGEDGSSWFHCPESLAPGYYDLEVRVGSRTAEACLIVAPNHAWKAGEGRTWGLFCPLYALHSKSSLGSGDFTDLEKVIKWMSGKGGRLMGSLPMFAAFLDNPCEPSPYAPVSRLFWNEFYLDPRRAWNWESSPAARDLYNSPGFQALAADLNASSLVDFRESMKLRRSLLQVLSNDFFDSPGGRGKLQLDEWIAGNPEVLKYARFRAAVERRGTCRTPGEFKSVVTDESGDMDKTANYHLYTQWLVGLQADHLREVAREGEVDLYMDLPLGVHPDGYDSWAYREYFAEGVSGGAPPDAFFTAGQDWGFRPMHPWKSAESGHIYFRRILRNLMEFSDVIRLDHVMNLHRLYWVPAGLPAGEGAYVRYPANELYAILMLESHRHECAVVGEDLGTVPPEVRETMDEHGILRMFVGQFEVDPHGEPRVHQPSGNMVASVNTHDTPTFSGFARCRDILDRVELGILEESEVEAEKESRLEIIHALVEDVGLDSLGDGDPGEQDIFQLLERWLLNLAKSPAASVLVNPEDLWLEDSPQNVPGTTEQKPNWRRKMKRSIEEIEADPLINRILEEINVLRKSC